MRILSQSYSIDLPQFRHVTWVILVPLRVIGNVMLACWHGNFNRLVMKSNSLSIANS